MSVDIIIPVYNAYDDLTICLESIYRHTNLVENRVILINDRSTDERIKPFLDSQKRENVVVIHNEENRGFSNNINLGMAQSQERDVILLNSDTIVTANWVEKMAECAYSDKSIGTVTPLSNNATLCSVPNFCEENTLPENMTVDQVASIVEECSLKKYPRITVAHGFCMLIKREVIKRTGTFDAETFQRGYGEENDFCNRAEQMGYIHVMCDNTYIYHSGTKSFVSKEKEEYIREHERILNARYPIQMHNNAVHCRNNPNGWVGKNIAYHLDIWNGKKNVLYLLQSDFREDADDHVGGTQLHVKQLALSLRRDRNIFVAARNREYLQVTAYTEKQEYLFRFYIGEREPFPVLRSRKLAEVFRTILAGFKIDLVHVHHTVSSSLDIYYEADKLGIPILFTAHDFYYVCPNEKLLDAEGKRCAGKETEKCAECLKQKYGIYHCEGYRQMWKAEHSKVLKLCSEIIVPSKSAKELFGRCYNDCADKIKVIEHGMDEQPKLRVDEQDIICSEKLVWKIEKADRKRKYLFICGTAWLTGEENAFHRVILKITDKNGRTVYFPTTYGKNADVLKDENRFYAYIPSSMFESPTLKIEVILSKNGQLYRNKNQKEIVKNTKYSPKDCFRVAFIGGLNEEKGGKIVSEIVKKGTSDIEWYVIGGIGEETLYRLKRENLIKTGIYYQEDLSTWLKYYEIDAICILSKWPETFSYTLSEAAMNHIPVICANVGALGQRTKENGLGITVEVENAAEETGKCIQRWKTDTEAYQRIKNKLSGYKHKTIKEMADEYSQLYQFMEKKAYNEKVQIAEETETLCHALIGNAHTGESNQELVYQIKQLENRIHRIENSAAFKVMQKAYGLRIPFKKEIRRMILKRS